MIEETSAKAGLVEINVPYIQFYLCGSAWCSVSVSDYAQA